MKKRKTIIGVLLILLSIAAMFFWEFTGREAILTEPVLVAKENISQGQKIDESMFRTVGVPRENLLEAALAPEDIGSLQNKIAAQLIAKNSQVTLDFFEDKSLYLGSKESIYVIKAEWIAMRSSSLRKGDVIDIYEKDGSKWIGTFRVAFVKDKTEREVRDVGLDNAAINKRNLLERTDGSSEINHLEVITTMEKYRSLLSCTEGENPTKLIIVQRGERIDS